MTDSGLPGDNTKGKATGGKDPRSSDNLLDKAADAVGAAPGNKPDHDEEPRDDDDAS